jgi:hypothetical protein
LHSESISVFCLLRQAIRRSCRMMTITVSLLFISKLINAHFFKKLFFDLIEFKSNDTMFFKFIYTWETNQI